MHEVAVGGAVGRRHADLSIGNRDRVDGSRQHQGDPCADEHAELPPRDKSTGLVVLSVLFKLILLAHDRSFIDAGLAVLTAGSS